MELILKLKCSSDPLVQTRNIVVMTNFVSDQQKISFANFE